MKKKLLSLALAATMVCSLPVWANAAEESAEEPITLTAYFYNELPWDTAVAEEITRRTGVSLEFVPVAGDTSEKLNLMLVSDQVPDIVEMDRGAAANDQYINNGKVIALDDLIEEYGPNIKKQLGDTMNKIRNTEDGKIYGIPSWFQNEVAPSPVFGFNIRMNYVKELGYYDTYVDKGYFTQDEFVSLLKEWKEKYPTIDGQESIAMAFNSENDGSHTYSFRGMYGITQYYEQDGKLYDTLRNPSTKEMYLFMNELYREGLLDKDWPVTKQTLYDEKIVSGRVLCSPAAYWNIKNDQLRIAEDGSIDVDNQMFPFLVVADGVSPDEAPYGPTSVMGWSLTYISSSNQDPVRTIKFFDFLMSEEGQYLTQWGVEGVHWNMEDGKRVVAPELAEMIDNGTQWDYFKEQGIRMYELLFKSGVAEDGQFYDMTTAYQEVTGKVDEVTAFAKQYLGRTAYDTTEYDNLGPDAGTPEALISTKLNDLQKEALPKVILAETAEEASELFDQLLADSEAAGLEQVEAIANEKHAQRVELWGLDK